jgi:Putative rhamnosyl transferase
MNDTFSANYTLEHPPEYSPYTIIHSILTRFMVGQASRYTLARARYLLFETFCWPTMYHQHNQNFYWLVLVDPGLDRRVLLDMQSLLQTMPNAFMILTNNTAWAADGVGVENVTSYGVGLRTVAQAFQEGNVEIVTGNTTYLEQALRQMNQPPLPQQQPQNQTQEQSSSKPILAIETLLDADDGLNNHGVQWIQDAAIQRIQEQQSYLKSTRSMLDSSSLPSANLESTWWFLCGTDHIEWHNRDIFKVTAEEYAISGLTAGLAGIRSRPYFCTSAGFTRIGLTVSPATMTFPKDAYSNHALAFYFPPCTDTQDLGWLPATNISVAHCFRRNFAGQPFILKSRSIGSDSMDNMNPRDRSYRDVAWLNDTDSPLLVNETELAWEMLVQDFSICRRDAWTTSLYLYEHRKQILRENKASRCSPGFPCYKAAKKNLLLMERYLMRQEVDQKEHMFKGMRHQMAVEKARQQRVTLAKLRNNASVAIDDLQKLVEEMMESNGGNATVATNDGEFNVSR